MREGRRGPNAAAGASRVSDPLPSPGRPRSSRPARTRLSGGTRSRSAISGFSSAGRPSPAHPSPTLQSCRRSLPPGIRRRLAAAASAQCTVTEKTSHPATASATSVTTATPNRRRQRVPPLDHPRTHDRPPLLHWRWRRSAPTGAAWPRAYSARPRPPAAPVVTVRHQFMRLDAQGGRQFAHGRQLRVLAVFEAMDGRVGHAGVRPNSRIVRARRAGRRPRAPTCGAGPTTAPWGPNPDASIGTAIVAAVH